MRPAVRLLLALPLVLFFLPDPAWAGWCYSLRDCVGGDVGTGRMLVAGGVVSGLLLAVLGDSLAGGGAMMLGEPPPPPSPEELQEEIDAAKARFEELQEELKAEAAKQLALIDKFNGEYDRLWREAIEGTEDYMRHYPELMRDLEGLWEAAADRKWAKEVAEWIDVGIEAAMMGLDAYHLGAAAVKGVEAAATGVGRAVVRESDELAARGAAAARAAEDAAAAGRAARAAEERAAAAAAKAEREAAEQAAARAEKEAADQAAKRAERESADQAAARAADDKAAARAAHEKELNEAIEREAAIARAERQAADEAEAAARAKADADAFQPQTAAEREKAIADGGMTQDHGEGFRRVARERDEVVMTQATNPTATAHIENGAATKNMHIKGKSADAGPAEGYIPYDQSLSPKISNPNQALLDKYKTKEGVLEHFKKEVEDSISHGYAKKVTVTGKDGKPIEVLGDPVTGKPITADYDLLAVGSRKPEMLQIPDEHLGNITAGGRELKDGLNGAAVGPKRTIDNPVVHHGPANSAPVNPGINYPVTSYQPNGNVVSIPRGGPAPHEMPDGPLADYFNKMDAQGYKMQPHPDWRWTRNESNQWVPPTNAQNKDWDAMQQALEALNKPPAGTP